MPYDSRTYRILIASPSDVEVEREIAVKVIQEWNDLHSYSRKTVILPLRWETHTAPEYGTRPQEVINRQIVDECDLLVGIFWTRIGTDTGVAASGTLEEIERVAIAGKPVMLYFSNSGVDPNTIDLDQITRLKMFKEISYPNGLSESYKSHIEFRDKFAKQIELKIRDLKKVDANRISPLKVEFAALDDGRFIGKKIEKDVLAVTVHDEDSVLTTLGGSYVNTYKSAINMQLEKKRCFPVLLAMQNISDSSVANLFLHFAIESNNSKLEVSDNTPNFRLSEMNANSEYLSKLAAMYKESRVDYEHGTAFGEIVLENKEIDDAKSKLEKLDKQIFTRTDSGWEFAFELSALQSGRMSYVKPLLYITPNEDSDILITTSIYADGFVEPLVIKLRITTKIIRRNEGVDSMFPGLKKKLREIERNTKPDDDAKQNLT